jgi:hypothetical protein
MNPQFHIVRAGGERTKTLGLCPYSPSAMFGAGTITRVASAVGEGSIAISFVHRVLAGKIEDAETAVSLRGAHP